jgi:hypothetical protein
MNMLIDCDEVFERLTRAPFPAPRNAADQAVLDHVAVCHECRCFAEALRPAVELLSEVAHADAKSDHHLPKFTADISLASMQKRTSPVMETHSDRFWLAALAGMFVGMMIMLTSLAGGRGRNNSLAIMTGGGEGATLHQTMLALAPLKLHETCLRTPAATDAAVELVCCTQCHAAGVQQYAAVDFNRLQLACAVCHGE